MLRSRHYRMHPTVDGRYYAFGSLLGIPTTNMSTVASTVEEYFAWSILSTNHIIIDREQVLKANWKFHSKREKLAT